MSCSEWYCWEILAIAASFLGPVPLASQSVLLITTSLIYQAAFASSAAAAVRQGNLIGANEPQRAKLAAKVAIGYGIVLGFINLFILLLNKSWWGKLFSNDIQVVQLVSKIVSLLFHYMNGPGRIAESLCQLPLVALFQVFDSGTGLAGGLMRGCGKSAQGGGSLVFGVQLNRHSQRVAAGINLASYYVVGMPISLYLTFGPLQLGLTGLWVC